MVSAVIASECMLDILCASVAPAACDTITWYGAQTFKEPTT